MLPLGGEGAVLGHDAPAVFFGAFLDVLAAGVDHGLDGEGHAFDQLLQRARAAVVQHLGLFVEDAANAVATELAHHAEAVAFGKLLDRVANVAKVDAGLDHHDALPHGFVGDVGQAFGSNRDFTDHEHAAGIAVPAVFDDGHVDVDDIAFFQRLVVGDAVADLLVDRGADGFGVGDVAATGVVQRGWNAALHLRDEVVRQLVQFVGSDTRFDEGRQVIQYFGGQLARHAHACNAVSVFVGDSHGARLSQTRCVCAGGLRRPVARAWSKAFFGEAPGRRPAGAPYVQTPPGGRRAFS